MLIVDNPEFIRLRRTKLRSKNMIVIALASIGVFGTILALFQYNMRTDSQLYQSYFFTVVGIQLVAGSIYALILASQNITLEREKNTYDFQRLVAMGPWRLGWGKLFGAACEAWFAILGGIFFSFIPVMTTAIPVSVWIDSQIVIVVFMLLVSSFGLMCSSVTQKTAQASGMTVFFMIMMMYYAAIGVSGKGATILAAANPARVMHELYQSCNNPQFGRPSFNFFGNGWLKMIPAYILQNLFFAALFFLITVRRLTDEELSIVHPKAAVAAFALLQVLVIGVCWDMFGISSMQLPALASFHGANAVALMALAFGLTPSAELLRGRLSRGQPNQHWRIFFELGNRLQDSPTILSLVLFGLAYAALAGALSAMLGIMTFPALAIIAMVFAMGIGTAALLLYINIYVEKGGLRLAAIVVSTSLTIPPLIVGSLISPEKVYSINPFAYITAFADDAELKKNILKLGGPISPMACPILCVALAVLLSILAAMRIRYLLDMDELQRQKEAAGEKPLESSAVATARAMLNADGPVVIMPEKLSQ